MNRLSVSDFLAFEQGVIKFNTIAGNKTDDKDLIPLYWDLCKEEAKELKNAPSKEEELDAYIDSIFVGFYHNILTLGSLKEETTWLGDVCNSNLGFSKDVHMKDLLGALEDNQPFGYSTSLVNLLNIVQDEFDICGAFDNVLESNLSKYSLKKNVDVQEEIHYITSQGRYDDVHSQEVEFEGEIYVVFYARQDLQEGKVFSGKGKIVKPSTFKEPSLTQFILK